MKTYVDNYIISAVVGNLFLNKQGGAMEKPVLSDHGFAASQVTKEEMGITTKLKIRGSALFMYRIFGGEKGDNRYHCIQN